MYEVETAQSGSAAWKSRVSAEKMVRKYEGNATKVLHVYDVMRQTFSVHYYMGNSTKITTSDTLRDGLKTLLGAYRGVLQADEKRLHEAMLKYERSCWAEAMGHAA